MPFAGFDDFDDCLRTMTEEEGHDEESARNICGALQAEEKSEHGNVDALADALEEGAGLIADVGVDLVSGVDVPAIDSKWVMLKDSDTDHDYRVTAPLLKAEDTDKRISYAAAMIPREPDKEGDVAPTPTVEKAAHQFLKGDGGIDTDHSLIDGEGEPVESWVLKQDREFTLPDGSTETYPEGTWMLGVGWGKDAWERIEAGELTGLSIYGMAEHVPLERAATCAECGESLRATKSQNGDTHKGGDAAPGDMGQETDDGPDIETVADSVSDLRETVESLKDTVEEDKEPGGDLTDVIREFVDRLAALDEVEQPPDALKESIRRAIRGEEKDADLSDAEADALADALTEKEVSMATAVDLLAEMDDVEAGADEIEAALDDLAGGGGDEMEADAEDGGDTEDVEKRTDDANLAKGADATGTAQAGVTGQGGTGDLSYVSLTEEGE